MIISLVKFHLIHPHIYLMPSSLPILLRFFSNARKYSCSTSFNQRLTQLSSPSFCLSANLLCLHLWRYFHKVLNSGSAFQRCQSIVCWLLLFLLGSISLKAICLFFWLLFFYFLAAFIIFVFVFIFGSFTMIFLFLVFFPPFWFAFSYFLVAGLIAFA